MYNNFTTPVIAYYLRHIVTGRTQLTQWDKHVVFTFSIAASGFRYNCRRFKPAAIAVIAGVRLPSMLECAVKVSETFHRLNGLSLSSELVRTRWPRITMDPRCRNRIRRVNELLTGELEWSMDLVNSTTSPERINDDRKRAMDDPDEHHQGGPIQAYTDGSFIDGKSGWAVIFGDTHFDEIYSSLPDEKHLRYEEFKNVRHMSGSNDPKFSVGIYDAELQAILRALMAVPVHRHVTIHTDNQAAISAITSPPMEARQLLRRSGRQWLSLITLTITDIVYVPAHTNSKTKQCVGNRCADVLAKRAATTRVHASTIPIETGDPYATVRDKRGHEGNDKGMVITTDIRRAALKRLYGNMRKQWISSNTQSAYSHECIGGSELWQWASIHGGSYTGFVMRAITNVLHWKNCAYTHDCIHRKGVKKPRNPHPSHT